MEHITLGNINTHTHKKEEIHNFLTNFTDS